MSDAAVFVVDDDALIRDSLEQLVKSVGLQVETFSSTQAFLDTELPDTPSCLILDIRMPGLSGLDLQDELVKRGISIPIIFITGHGTVPMSVRAMKAGAVDFLQKPFEDQELLDIIHHAIEQNKQTRIYQTEINEIEQRIKSLTLREHEILVLVTAGMLNKQISYDLKLSENTVKSHRARIMRKMEVESLAELVRATEKAGIHPPQK
ncbi:MAG: response regulator transcription factor [Deltaproteobacteria bacterium]|nr:response regulator transcription factor [Deltaproteobacteria bacterium]